MQQRRALQGWAPLLGSMLTELELEVRTDRDLLMSILCLL